ncbi:ABC transporter permease [Streptomyces purpurogeneiscleroticus]|uniref:ABC transporter permease n=1 Tax=Streptomyces purpurogeneiscleroticus TaxID=68259 RepID=UPI001CC01226|nr:ABC transporter permease [Streptomyces purpurogeneiscleroticus]MBZ4018414.1 ABC transporter permease [Streptomyces purpurogeneiscleroticus]
MALASQVLTSEWTKIRSVRSTVWTLGIAVVVTVVMGAALCLLVKNDFESMPVRERITFDATSTAFAGMGLGQLAMIVFGVLVVSNEYSTGMIRTSLAAVPQRGAFLFSKIAVATLLAFVVSLVTSFVAFSVGQAMLGPDLRVGLGDPGVLRAVFGGALYMTLIALFSMGVAAALRSPMLSLGILMPFFFLISNILGAVSATRKLGRYLPDQAGQKVMKVVTTGDDVPYGPWGGLGIMALWVIAALIAGYLFLKKRDA